MRRGRCVKCGAATVRGARNGIELSDNQGVGTFLRPHVEPGTRGMFRNQAAEIWAFACTSCGYLELHLLDPAGIAFVQEKWAEVAPPDGAPPPPPPPPPG